MDNVETNDKVNIDVDDYVALQLRSEKLDNILEIIFENVTVSDVSDTLFLEERELMSYLKVVEKRLYNGTLDRLKEEKKKKEANANE